MVAAVGTFVGCEQGKLQPRTDDMMPTIPIRRITYSRSLRTKAITALAIAALVGGSMGTATHANAGDDGSGVRIVRDEYGVPHVYASTVRGLFFGQGWATAQDRLWQADLVRRSATGHLAELIGPGDGDGNVSSDEFFRQYSGGKAGLGRLVRGLSSQNRTAVEGFVAGVNSEIAKAVRDGTLPLEYAATGNAPKPWTPEDVAASVLLSVLQVGGTGADELTNAGVLQDLVGRLGTDAGAAAFADTHWLDDPSAPTTIPSAHANPSSDAASAPVAARTAPGSTAVLRGTVLAVPMTSPRAAARAKALLAAATRNAHLLGLGGPGHSNAVALSGRLTGSGQPLLLGGPQIGYSAPQGFMEVSLHGSGFDATGVTLAGVPGVLIGAGFDHAWTVTSGGDDNQDFYVETLDPAAHPGRYLFRGRWVPYACREESIQVAGGAPLTFQACESTHGIVLGRDGDNALTLKDATRARVDDSLTGFLGIDQARSLRQFIAAAQSIGGSLNLTYADSVGHIAYAHVGSVPVRPADDNRFLPHPGDGSDEWHGFVPKSQLPLVVDPAQGWLANWNNKPAAGWQSSSDGFWQWGPVQRVQALTRQLVAVRPHSATMATLERINRTAGQTGETPTAVADDVVVPALLEPMLAAVSTGADPRLASIVHELRSWDQQRVDRDGDGSYDSSAVTVFNAWYSTFVDATVVPRLGADYAADGFERNTTANVVSRLLAGRHAVLPLQGDYLHGTTVRGVVTTSLISALDGLTRKYGTSSTDRWLTPDATISWSALGAVGVPDTAWMNRGTYNQVVSLDMVGPSGENVVAPGQSGDPRSPHFADQLALFAAWRYKPMRIQTADVASHAVSVETLSVS